MMATPILPPATPGSQQTHDNEYSDFIAKLAAYHQERGTQFETQPRVGSKHVNLLQLYKAVVARGGYDKVSEEKLAWRKVTSDLGFGSNNLPAAAFQLKTHYYKFLAAYEIKHLHGKEPPPKEILEDVSAKGGDLLNRTVENYFRPTSREAERLRTGDDSSSSSDEEADRKKTPRQDKTEADDVGSTGRVTRGA